MLHPNQNIQSRQVIHTECVSVIASAVDFSSSAYANATARLKARGMADRVADYVLVYTLAGTLQAHTLVRADGTSEVVYVAYAMHALLTSGEFVSSAGGDPTVGFMLYWTDVPL